ncbi:MAG: hypothetical protein AAF492_03555 [Verrucomicrobiota bacterium]
MQHLYLNLVKQAVAIGCVSLLTGCASILSKSDYPVSITSSPSGADVKVSNSSGLVVHQDKTPTTAVLPAEAGFFKAETYTMDFSKPGYDDTMRIEKATMDPWFLGNIIFGGFVGVLLVDPLTGAMWQLPPQTQAVLGPKEAVTPTIPTTPSTPGTTSTPTPAPPPKTGELLLK